MVIGSVVAIFYCLDALHGERRDRSILFWKSLPVSDLTTVLSKASIPLVIMPLLDLCHHRRHAVDHAAAQHRRTAGQAVQVSRTFWTQLSLLPDVASAALPPVAVHALWYAPIYGWLLLVSGWARRAAFLGPCCRYSRSAWWRRLPSTLRTSPPC